MILSFHLSPYSPFGWEHADLKRRLLRRVQVRLVLWTRGCEVLLLPDTTGELAYCTAHILLDLSGRADVDAAHHAVDAEDRWWEFMPDITETGIQGGWRGCRGPENMGYLASVWFSKSEANQLMNALASGVDGSVMTTREVGASV